MSYLGQNNDYDYDYDFDIENDVYTEAKPEIPWWQKIWAGTKEVIATGAETFTKIAPYVIDRPGVTKLPLPVKYPERIDRRTGRQTRIEIDPITGRQRTVYYSPYTPGQRIPTGNVIVTLPSGQRVLRQTQSGVTPEWLWPVAFLAGGILLTTMGKRKR